MEFAVQEYSGSEVYLLDKEGEPVEEPLRRREDLQPGTEIAVPTLFGYCKMRVEENIPGMELHAESARAVAILEFDTDDRHCWTSSMTYSKAAMKMYKETA